ncbi:CBN-NAS-30 protein [Aphelenchoides avenae]|nr:CBN-NAS-30 protein [Aphelenchus avenae]
MTQLMIQSAANNCPGQHGQLKSMLERGEIEVDGSYGGDIVLTVDQAKAILQELRERGRSRSFRARRQLVTNPVHLWNASEPIPYRFEDTDEAWRANIRAGLEVLQTETCLRFDEHAQGQSYLAFTRNAEKPWN